MNEYNPALIEELDFEEEIPEFSIRTICCASCGDEITQEHWEQFFGFGHDMIVVEAELHYECGCACEPSLSFKVKDTN